jgi:hypothetical protein
MPTNEEKRATIAAARELIQRYARNTFGGLRDDLEAFNRVFGVQPEQIEKPEDQQRLLEVLEAAKRARSK